jgi:sulfatase modifying factor 1
MSVKQTISVGAMAAVTGLSTSIAWASVTIPTVPIGNPGNAADPTTGFGAVAYSYNIGTTEVTNAQYAAFLNAVARTDTNNLYNTLMATGIGGITRSGLEGSYTYGTISGRADNPVNFVSFWDGTRFANWLHNGQPAGVQDNTTTEEGAYTLSAGGISSNSVTRNANWQWALPSEDEWYKAAYHQPASQGGDTDDYWRWVTSNNAVPTTAEANFGNVIGNTTPVGSYSANFYGAFDMGGNVWEWTEAKLFSNARIVRGGSLDDGFGTAPWTLESSYRVWQTVWEESANVGFRVSQIPGPSSVALLVIGALGVLHRRRR